ncbi:MAG: hypothetical protein GXO89_03290, partial [Chlorobi bacterium]|nr:hypothetical protein [Chlorobiota bacterium]
MKFLAKINLNYLVLLTVMLVVISFAGYFIIKWRFQNETREKLEQTSELIKKQIGETGINCKLYPLIDVRKSKSKKTIDAVYKEIFIQNKAEDYED